MRELVLAPCYVVEEIVSKLFPKVIELIEAQPGLECLSALIG